MMFEFMFSLSIISSLTFVLISHPLVIALMIIFQSTIISLFISFSPYSSWFAYILFMIFLSGMMIIFIYISSLTSNEIISKFNMSLIHFPIFIIFITLVSLILSKSNINTFTYTNQPSMNSTNSIISNMYSTNTSFMTIFLITYLLVVLIMVVKTSMLTKGPLRLKK
uniref:NADH dehydrogenase subunit 6 n=1 Tax=Bahadzia jaraguensis TaxID=1041811 RepID=K7ZTT6_BAHJA|nr:NADH dehydrogenase subunit 6 [Bahadzia jaraguensis]